MCGDFEVQQNESGFDVEKFIDSMDATFDGEVSDLDLPADVVERIEKIEAEMDEDADSED